MIINVFSKNRGWLFEDLKNEISKYGAIASETPIPSAAAWICIRSEELADITDRSKNIEKSRTVVQIHNATSDRLTGFGAISFVHEAQKVAWGDFSEKHLVLPIGSRRIPYTTKLPRKPTIGFFGREVDDNLKRSAMFGKAVLMAKEKVDFDVLMIGERLEHIAHIGTYEKRDAGPDDYRRVDATVTCSVSPMIPLSTYETCSAGRTVITTPRIWPSGANWEMVKTGETVEQLADHIVDVVTNRKTYKPVNLYNRADWAKAQVELAKGLVT